MRKTAFPVLIAFFMITLVPVLGGGAFEFEGSKTCKSVRIVVQNAADKYPIKVYRIDHYDFEAKKWRKTRSFLPRVIKAGSSGYFGLRNLKKVKNKKTIIQIAFKKGEKNKRGKFKYPGKMFYHNTKEFICEDYINMIPGIYPDGWTAPHWGQ